MRRFKVEFVLAVNSPDPEDWVTESIVDQLDLDEGETIEYLKVECIES